jgi:hypothetical protein
VTTRQRRPFDGKGTNLVVFDENSNCGEKKKKRKEAIYNQERKVPVHVTRLVIPYSASSQLWNPTACEISDPFEDGFNPSFYCT